MRVRAETKSWAMRWGVAASLITAVAGLCGGTVKWPAFFLMLALGIYLWSRALSRYPFARIAGITVLSLIPWFYLPLTLIRGTYCVFECIFESRVEIFAVREQEITWPSLPQPVGIRLEVELARKPPIRLTNGPIVWLGGPGEHENRNYALWNLLAVPSVGVMDQTYVREETTSTVYNVAFDLYPTCARWIKPDERVCIPLECRQANAQPKSDEPRLNAIWRNYFGLAIHGLFDGGTIDLSERLTDVIRATSQYEKHPERWRVLTESLTPQNLLDAGYRECEEPYGGPRECYCRGESDARED